MKFTLLLLSTLLASSAQAAPNVPGLDKFVSSLSAEYTGLNFILRPTFADRITESFLLTERGEAKVQALLEQYFPALVARAIREARGDGFTIRRGDMVVIGISDSKWDFPDLEMSRRIDFNVSISTKDGYFQNSEVLNELINDTSCSGAMSRRN